MDEEWPNRSSFTLILQQRIDDTRGKASVLALLFLELKEFRNLRNIFGRAFSDALHIEAALRLHAVLGRAGYLAPLGDGAFACVLHDVAGCGDVQAIADEISATLGAVFVLAGGQRRSVGVSIGIGMYPRDARDGEALLQCANIAMHVASAGGKGEHLFTDAGCQARCWKRRCATASHVVNFWCITSRGWTAVPVNCVSLKSWRAGIMPSEGSSNPVNSLRWPRHAG